MVPVIWAPSALEDIDAIAEFISRDSPANADLFVDRLMKAADRLKQHPESGRVIPEIGDPSRREIIYGAYRLMYRLEAKEVWITGVVHGSRNWRPAGR